jgi:hypothetical protein
MLFLCIAYEGKSKVPDIRSGTCALRCLVHREDFQFLLPGVSDGAFPTVGQHDRSAICPRENKENRIVLQFRCVREFDPNLCPRKLTNIRYLATTENGSASGGKNLFGNNSKNFLDCGQALYRFKNAVFSHRKHALGARLFFHIAVG